MVGLGTFSPLAGIRHTANASARKATVSIVRNEKAVSNRGVIDQEELSLMLHRALFSAVGEENVRRAWVTLGIEKHDVVGIKVNSNPNAFPRFVRSSVAYALSDSLIKAQIIPPGNIIIYDRYTSELEDVGYRVNTSDTQIRCFGADENIGFAPDEGITRIVTDMCTKIINISALKTLDNQFAASLTLKNHIGSLPPDQMPKCHDNTELITLISTKPSIKNRTILAVCDGLRGTYKRGVPWYWKGIIMSCDPVAVEYAAHQVINEKRSAENSEPLAFPDYVRLADTKYGLGICNPANMEIISETM